MRNFLYVFVISLYSCEFQNIYTDDYKFRYRRPIGLIMSPTLDSLNLSGKNVKVGVIDAGFGNFYKNKFTKNLKVADYKDFIDQDTSNFFSENEHDHGTMVTSSIGGKNNKVIHGLAYNSTYFLAKTENVRTEKVDDELRLIEAFDWLISCGVDIINISVAYTIFDEANFYQKNQLDGKTARSSRHIDSILKINPGLIVVVSAGNKGNKEWGNIMIPGDVKEVITVGSTDIEGETRWKSSGKGPEYLNYIKPDVVTYPIPLGNSHTAPVIAGLSALIKEWKPLLIRQDYINALHFSGSNKKNPNREIGYGVPDSRIIIKKLK